MHRLLHPVPYRQHELIGDYRSCRKQLGSVQIENLSLEQENYARRLSLSEQDCHLSQYEQEIVL